ncbi:MAG TPA: hypothetical protein VGQ87_02725 [Patescibacteria group bacterium]|jgi:hypothetical protein|nr:hypothetical protein [Patescibacteria group bacterium]
MAKGIQHVPMKVSREMQYPYILVVGIKLQRSVLKRFGHRGAVFMTPEQIKTPWDIPGHVNLIWIQLGLPELTRRRLKMLADRRQMNNLIIGRRKLLPQFLDGRLMPYTDKQRPKPISLDMRTSKPRWVVVPLRLRN